MDTLPKKSRVNAGRLACCLVLCLAAVQLRAATTVIFDTRQITGNGSTNAMILVEPLQGVLTNGQGGVILNLPHNLRTGSDGTTRTNLYPGLYRVTIRTTIPASTTIYTNNIPDTASVIYSGDYKTASVGSAASSVAYSQAAADAKFVIQTNGSGRSNILSRPRLYSGVNTNGSSSVSNMVWTCTNSVTGEGEWRASSAGTSQGNNFRIRTSGADVQLQVLNSATAQYHSLILTNVQGYPVLTINPTGEN